MAESPTSRTIKFLAKQNIIAGNVERFVRQAGPFGQRYDLFGFIDVIACYSNGIYGLQITSTGNVSSRIKKILNERPEEAKSFIESGGKIEVWGWSKRGKKGARKLWAPKVYKIVLDKEKNLVSILLEDPSNFPRRHRRLI
tara:strand:+ start:450 stop:872 length:423 start_codon:yes stop_codon:yes gene_type:complete